MKPFRQRLYEIIFEADTKAGRIFDLTLLVVILFSVLTVILESIPFLGEKFKSIFSGIEWTITILFTIEYLCRIWTTEKPSRYMISFYGIIDLLALLPTYIIFFVPGGQSLMVIRAMRLIRVFRILKLSKYIGAGRFIVVSLWKNKEKMIVFILFVLSLTLIIGTLIYLIEGKENGFTDIPTSIYWAIVTLTTVGYGDLSPATAAGKFLASVVMILGYAIIAVPTGIITAGIIEKNTQKNTQVCSGCMYDNHDDDALFCKKCGKSLNNHSSNPLQE